MTSTTARPATPAVGERRTAQAQLDAMADRLQDRRRVFARLSIPDRVRLARAMQAGYLRIADRSVEAACAAKGIRRGSPAEGEEWATGPWSVVRHLRLVAESLGAIAATGNTPVGPVSHTYDGQCAVRVFPANRVDGMLFSRVTVDVHLQKGVTEEAMHAARAGFYRGRGHDGRTVLVLGAGNIAAIAAMDVITKLFNEGKVCLLKMNPVNAYLGPFIEDAFGDAIGQGFLAVAYGGADEGEYLVHHPAIDEIHLTGSDHTYDQIVWGSPGVDRDARRARKTPLVTKPMTSELGNVSPVLVVPGPYRDKELAFQAEGIAGAAVCNASFLCNSPKMLVSPKGWARRPTLVSALERALGLAPTRSAYYPGAAERWRRLTEGRTDVRHVGTAGPGELPWTLLLGLDATDVREAAFSTEPFCPILSETEVGSDDPLEFLDRAVDFVNNRLWGTLCADLIIHPTALADPQIAEAVERAIARLHYGTVAVNGWSGLAFSYGSPPWGGYPGATPTDVQSGSGWVHNTPMLEGIEKAVLRNPLTTVPKPATFPSHRTAHALLRRMTYLDERASWTKVPGVVATAMRG